MQDLCDLGLKVFCILILVFLLSPIAVIIPTAFTADPRIRFPIRDYSLKWFITFFNSPLWMKAFRNSLVVALGTTALCLILALPAAHAFRFKIPAKALIDLLVSLPFFVPSILTAIGLLTTSVILGLYGSIIVIIIGHTLWAITIVFITLTAALSNLDRSIEEAAKSLGASGLRTFFEITLPLIKEAVVASALFAFVLSINEFLIAYFVSTPTTATTPVYIWSYLREGLSPTTSVCSMVIVVMTLTIFLYVSRIANLAEGLRLSR